MERVSFDYDGTLGELHVQIYAKELIKRGVEVWIVTARPDDNHPNCWGNSDIYKVANSLNIPTHRIVFTNLKPKYEYFIDNSFMWHLDDREVELKGINTYTEVPAISVLNNRFWRYNCEKLLN